MPPTFSRLSLLRQIVQNIGCERLEPGTITQVRLDASPFVMAKITPGGVIGIRKEAAKALFGLADAIFSASHLYQRGTTFKVLYSELSNVIIRNFFEPTPNHLDATDVAFTESKIDEWFQGTIATHQLYIPCLLSPWRAPPFNVGPVKFRYIDDFVAQERSSNENAFDFGFEQLLNAMKQNSAHWMATVEVDKCTKDRAWEVGDLAVDLALVGIQLAVPLEHSEHMARMTARTIPRFRHPVAKSGGGFSAGVSNQEPGLCMGEGMFALFLSGGTVLLQAVGSRIATFLGGGSSFPNLEQAWADAAYWFHEGLAEPLDTIAIPKLETAAEVLLRAESSRGSESRLLKAISVFYGLGDDQLINPESQVTVKEFAKGVVKDRSRILHGTWSTLTHSFRDSRPNLTSFVHELLAMYAVELEAYGTTAEATDDVEKFLNAVESRRRKTSSSGTSY